MLLLLTVVVIVAAAHPNHHTLQVYGNYSLGYYYVEVGVGSPPQMQALIIDTGSNILAVPCKGCTHCSTSHLHQPFNVNGSATSSYVSCQHANEILRFGSGVCSNCKTQPTGLCNFHIAYAEGSVLQGMVVKDLVDFGVEGQRIRTTFGCTLTESNQFIEQKADGILGLTPTRDYGLLEQLYKYHTGVSELGLSFGLCLAQNGGKFIVGGINQELIGNDTPVVIKFSPLANLYSMQAKALHVGDLTINLTDSDLGPMKVFIDSGATFTYFPARFYNQLAAHLINIGSSLNLLRFEDDKDICFKTPNGEPFSTLYNKFLNISFAFETGTIEWQPSDYLINYRDATDTKCLGFMSYDRFLLGTSWLTGRYVHFDLQKMEVRVQQGRCSDELKRVEKKLTTQSIIQVIRNPTAEPNAQATFAIIIALSMGVMCFFCPFILERMAASGPVVESDVEIRHIYEAAETIEERHEPEMHQNT